MLMIYLQNVARAPVSDWRFYRHQILLVKTSPGFLTRDGRLWSRKILVKSRLAYSLNKNQLPHSSFSLRSRLLVDLLLLSLTLDSNEFLDLFLLFRLLLPSKQLVELSLIFSLLLRSRSLMYQFLLLSLLTG